jgi:rare lipoprotein A
MRRSLRLVAATAWLLLDACADRPPAAAQDPARAPRGVDTTLVVLQPASGREPADARESVASPGAEAHQLGHAGLGASGEPLAQRYARSRVLAVQHGSASYYSDAFAGRSTASGAAYEPRGFTAAHRSLPFGTVLRVTRSDGAASVYVKVTDRGPYGPKGRILDLSRAAAERLNMLRAGVVKIKLEVVEYGPPRKARRRRR